jgi:hypothetical protein
MFGIYFYRYYFRRKPYFTLSITLKSLLPSTKIIFLTIVIVSFLLILPYIPLFVTNNTVLLEKYLDFLDIGMQKSKLIDFASNIFFVFISPIILYRPFMAWIASLVGRKGSMRVAFGKTRGNYWNFFLLGLAMSFPFIIIGQLEFYYNLSNYLIWFLFGPLTVFYSIVFAKCYEFFYMGHEEE